MSPELPQAPAQAAAPSAGAPPSTDTLNRIAGILGVPVASFYPDAERSDAAVAEAADLVTAFVTIDSPPARRACLAFVRAMASS